jgi:hypothetical protein
MKPEKSICPICGKPCGNYVEGAKVYHMACLMEATKHLRKKK